MDHYSKSAARYYLNLASKKGKLFYPRTYEKIMDKVVQKYSRDTLLSEDFFQTICENRGYDSDKSYEVIKYLSKYYGDAGHHLTKNLTGETLLRLARDFETVFSNGRNVLAGYVEKCVLDGYTISEGALDKFIQKVVKMDSERENPKKGYNFATEMKLLHHLINNDYENDYLKVYKEEYRHRGYLDSNTLTLLYDLLTDDYTKTSKTFDAIISDDKEAEEMMYLINETDAMSDLIVDANQISNIYLKEKLELEYERKLYNDFYKLCFDNDEQVNFAVLNEETILNAIGLNVTFLCGEYIKSYEQYGYSEEDINKKVNKAATALNFLLSKTKDIYKMDLVYGSLKDANNGLLDELEYRLDLSKANELLYFARGTDAGMYIESAFLRDAKSYYQALELEKKTTSLKVNNELIEKVVYNLVRFPNEELLKNEENVKIIFELNNEFAKKRMAKKANIDKK